MFGLDRLFSGLFNIEISEPKEDVEKTEERKEETNQINTTADDGWQATVKLNEILEYPDVIKISEHLRKDISWLENTTQESLTHIRKYKTSDLLKMLVKNRFVDSNDPDYLDKKRSITISSIYYKFPIPSKLYCFDDETLIRLLKYVYLCETFKINLDKCNNLEPSNVLVNNISDYVKDLLGNPALRNVLDDLSVNGYKALPNAYFLYSTVMLNTHKDSEIKKLDVSQFRKLMTCIFLECGIAIPRSYLHLDKDVINWVNKEAGYNTVDKPDNVVFLSEKR